MRETSKALAAFHEYCLLGPDRSLRKLAESRTKTEPKPDQSIDQQIKQYKTWSSAHHWQERVKQYDAERIAEKRRKQEAEIEAMNERHAKIGVTQQAKAIEQIKTLIEAKAFGSMAAVQLLKLATDLERLARGAATERSEVTGKDGGPIEVEETIVETFWGRGTDPRKRNDDEKDLVEDVQQVQGEDEEETEVSVEFGKDDEEE